MPPKRPKPLSDLLELSRPLPKDPFEALVAVRARIQALNTRTVDVMSAIYPDYSQVIDQLCSTEERLTRALGSFTTLTGTA